MHAAEAMSHTTAIHQLIAERAYGLWESQGRPHGYHLINWHQAEQEIVSCLEQAAGSEAAVSAQPSLPTAA